jgi:hypothetical protein
MYIVKLKDGPKRVKKTFSMILERVFLKWYDGGGGGGGNEIPSKRIFEVEVFFPSQNIDFPFYLKRLLKFFFSVSWGLRGFDDIWGEKSLLQKLLFEWLQYTGGGRIFQNGVMHANVAKQWL